MQFDYFPCVCVLPFGVYLIAIAVLQLSFGKLKWALNHLYMVQITLPVCTEFDQLTVHNYGTSSISMCFHMQQLLQYKLYMYTYKSKTTF